MQGLSDNPFWALIYCESEKESNSRKRETKASVTLNPSKANLHITPHYSWNRNWGNKRGKSVTQDTRANVLLAMVPPASLYIQKSTTVSNKFSEFLDPFTWTSPISPHGALSLSLSQSHSLNVAPSQTLHQWIPIPWNKPPDCGQCTLIE